MVQARFWQYAIEATFGFQARSVYLATSTTGSRRRTARAYLFIQAQTMGGKKFIFYMVELVRGLVVLQVRKSKRWAKYWVNGATRFLQCLARIFESDFHELNLFCYSRFVYSWPKGGVKTLCKDNTSKGPGFTMRKCAVTGYRWNWWS